MPGFATGSARSVEGLNILDSLSDCEHLLTKYGGHAAAAGCTLPLENVDKLRKYLCKSIKLPAEIKKTADIEIKLAGINNELYQKLLRLAPFGEGNPLPVLYACNIEIASSRDIRGHLELVLKDKTNRIQAMWWWAREQELPEGRINAVFTLTKNHFAGEERLQLNILDIMATEEKVVPLRVFRTFVDLRGMAMQEVLTMYPMAQYFQEGSNGKFKNRYQIVNNDSLVLISIPPGPKILREILALSSASDVILAYPIELPNVNIVKQIIGAAKYALKNHNGHLSIPKLSAALLVPENFIWESFSALKDIIKLKELGTEEIRVTGVQSGKINHSLNLENIIKEVKSFREFMVKQDLRIISNYFR